MSFWGQRNNFFLHGVLFVGCIYTTVYIARCIYFCLYSRNIPPWWSLSTICITLLWRGRIFNHTINRIHYFFYYRIPSFWCQVPVHVQEVWLPRHFDFVRKQCAKEWSRSGWKKVITVWLGSMERLVKLINNSWRKRKRNHESEGVCISDTESCWFT
jgi:hypothetical protein